MPIHVPHAHLYDSVKLEVAKAKLGHEGRKSLYAPLNLVAYIDMMTMLVIFLLMSFSATGEILFVQKNIVLPDAQNWTELERAPVIGVSKDVVTLDGSQVATADDLMKDSATGDFKIAELHDKLVTLKNNYKLLHPSEEFNGIAIIQSDKNVEFKMLKKIMSLSDSLMWRYFDLLSNRAAADIQQLKWSVGAGANLQAIKLDLAAEIAARFHSRAAVQAAREAFMTEFPQAALPNGILDIHVAAQAEGMRLNRVLMEAGLAASSAEGNCLIEQRAVWVNRQCVEDRALMLTPGPSYLLQVGALRIARVTLRPIMSRMAGP